MSVKATTTVSISLPATFSARDSFVSTALALPAAAARPGDEALEEVARPGQVGGELLRVTLHGDDETVVGLDTLDCPVLAAGGLLQAVRQPLDRLVVEAVDADLVLARRLAKLRRRVDLDGVGQVAAAERANFVTLQVLNQRAAHRDIDHLLPAADAEHRNLPFAGLAEQRQLGRVELRVGISKLLVPPLSIKGWVDVPPSRQQEPVKVRERSRSRHQVDGFSARRRHRAAVGHVVLETAPGLDRDPDLRAFVVGRHVTIQRRRVRIRSWQALPVFLEPWVP